MEDYINMRILIIALAGIGDLVMATPTIKAVRNKYPESEIDLLVFPYGGKEVLEGSKYINETHIFVDRTHTLTKKKPSIFNFLKTLFLLFKLRRKRFDLSISVHPSASVRLGFIAKIINAKMRIGFESKYYTNIIKLKQLHKVERNFKLLEPLGIKITDKKLYFHISKENEEFAENFLGNGLFVGMHPGGYWKRELKKWPLERFAKLATILNKKFGAKILVFEGPSDKGDYQKIEEYMEIKPIIVKTSLKNAAAVIKKCSLFISNDTGMMHIAEAMDVPTIDILGWADLDSGPYYEKNKKLLAWKKLPCHGPNCKVFISGGICNPTCNFECYTEIKAEDVFKIAKGVLK